MVNSDELVDSPLLSPLNETDAAVVAALARVVQFADGSQIFAEGQPATRCWIVRSGKVALETDRPGMAPIVLQTLGRGDLLGWSWIVEPYRWRFTATAVGAVELWEFEADDLLKLATEHPDLAFPMTLRLIETLAERLHATRARLLDVYRSPRDT